MLATDITTFRVVKFTTFDNHYLSSSEQHYHYSGESPSPMAAMQLA